jgi:CubicO group peptidase (beta-lactamase class C family)
MKTSDGKDTDYGIGWTVDRDAKGRRRVRHSGGAQGGTANLVIYPEQRLVVALLVNSDESFTGRAPAIAEVFADEQ